MFIEDELVEMDDEPDPENDVQSKAKDDLNMFSDSEDEQGDEKDLNEAGKELKAMLKKESGGNGSSDDDEEEEEDEDIDKEFSKSAVFMQGKYLATYMVDYIITVCVPFYIVHYYNNLMKVHHYHKSHQISSVSLEKMNIIILVFK